jgi:hypothetical protein
MRKAALLFEVMIRPRLEIFACIPGKEFLADPMVGRFPKGRFCAVLAELDGTVIRWFRPCARDALETVGFILGQQEAASIQGYFFSNQMGCHCA